MKALLINGSPRPNGCTFTALTELANTLEAEGSGNLAHGRRNRLIMQTKKKSRKFPLGELPGVHTIIVYGFWQGASGWAHPVFVG